MLKKEIIYRELLSEATESKTLEFTQLALSKKFGFSLSTVNNALKPLEQMGAIEKRGRSFLLTDVKKILTYWATARNLQRDILYSTRAEMPVQKIEGSMPQGIVFTAYSGYRFLFRESPADYGEVYLYAGKKELEEITERFPLKKGPPNLFILEKDPFMGEGEIAPLPQLYVDLWNLREWYARDFLDALERRMFP